LSRVYGVTGRREGIVPAAAAPDRAVPVREFDRQEIKESLGVYREDEFTEAAQRAGLSRGKEEVYEQRVENAVRAFNDALAVFGRRFQFSLHEGTKRLVVKVVDTETEEVLQEVPPEKILDMVEELWRLAGLLVDERV
jgi:flagellar protein FlaG